MSWDVYIMRAEASSVDDLPDDYQPESLGDAQKLRDELLVFFGGELDWSDPAWGILNGQGFSYEFNFTEAGAVDGFMMHVRGGGDAITPIVAMCREFGWQAVDTSLGDFIDLTDPSTEGWEGFQKFRDRIIDRYNDTDRN